MRFERLFADLEGQLEAADQADLAAEVSDRTRHARAQVLLADRFRASLGAGVRLRLLGGGLLEGTVRGVGSDWLLIRDGLDADVLVRPEAVLEVGGIAGAARPAGGTVADRVTLRYLLGGLVRSRSTVTLGLVDGSSLVGTIDAVGADALDLGSSRLDEPAEWASASGRPARSTTRVVPLAALVVIREQ